MAALIQTPQLIAQMAYQAHVCIDRFTVAMKKHPDQAWESLVDLRELLDQLQRMYPAKAFRRREA